MRFILFDDFRLGVLRGRTVIDASELLHPTVRSVSHEIVPHLISRFGELRPALEVLVQRGDGVPLESVRLRPPVPRPVQLLCAIRNYKDGREIPEIDFFLKSPTSIIGPGDTVELPDVPARVFHHEAELAVVIGRAGRNVPAARAMDYVFGYTGFIDVSARNIGTSFYQRKSFVTFGPMGPVLVSADEIPDPHRLRVRLWVNGELRQDFNTAEMANRIEQLIAAASATSGLLPGDVIATGTHHEGLGPLQGGDVVTLEVECVGQMTVRVADPLGRTWDADGM